VVPSALSRDRLSFSCHRHSQTLDGLLRASATSGRHNHHFSVRVTLAFVLRNLTRPSPPPTSVTTAEAPSCGCGNARDESFEFLGSMAILVGIGKLARLAICSWRYNARLPRSNLSSGYPHVYRQGDHCLLWTKRIMIARFRLTVWWIFSRRRPPSSRTLAGPYKKALPTSPERVASRMVVVFLVTFEIAIHM